VVNSVWNNASGVWQTAADWSTGVVPGSTATAVIGENPILSGATTAISPFVLTTGSSPVAVNSLTEINNNATLEITSDTTVGTSTNEYGISQIAGEIEITGGNTLTAPFLQQLSATADLQIEPGGTLAIAGHDDLGFANYGTIVADGNTIGMFVQGTALVDDGVIDAGPVLNGASVVSTGGFISIGQDGGGGMPAAVTVESGATVTDTYAFLGSDPTSFGSLTLTGAHTTWDDVGGPTGSNIAGGMIVGDDDQASNGPSPLPLGTAQLVVEENATLNEATYAEIGATADSAGSATVETDGVWNIGTAGTGTLDVGVAGNGTLTVQSGGTLDLLGSGSFEIGQDTGGDGTVTVTDGLLVAGSITVGGAGTGSLTVGSVGTVEATGVTVGSGSTINLSGGVLDPLIPVGVNGSGVIQGYGTLEGNVSLNATSAEIIANGGTLEITGSVTGNGTLELADGSSSILKLDGSVAAGNLVTFLGAAGTLQLTGASSTISGGLLNGFAAPIAGLNVGASNAVPTNDIDLSKLAIGTINSATLSGSTLTVKDTGGSFNLTLASAPAAGAFVDWKSDGGSGTDIFLSNAPCYCRGTLILTELGERAVEDLQIGDRLATRAGLRPIKWVGRRSYDPRFIRGQKSVLPVVISAGALAHGVPARDLWVSPEHALYLDGVLVPARLLINGMTITQVEAVDRLEYFHIELDSHDVILAEGAPAETYIECDNRLMFHNAAEHAELYPDALTNTGQFCAPRIEDGAAALAAIHARLLARAAALGHLVTGDPGLHLVADGVAILAAHGRGRGLPLHARTPGRSGLLGFAQHGAGRDRRGIDRPTPARRLPAPDHPARRRPDARPAAPHSAIARRVSRGRRRAPLDRRHGAAAGKHHRPLRRPHRHRDRAVAERTALSRARPRPFACDLGTRAFAAAPAQSGIGGAAAVQRGASALGLRWRRCAERLQLGIGRFPFAPAQRAVA
jgi:T5SS/PEP-CTERM-associated repeat protein